MGGKTKGFIKTKSLGWAEGEGKGLLESLTLLSQRLNARGYRCRLTEGFLGWVFFCVWFNVHTFDRRHRADRRVKGWLRR